jgi:acyl-CoA synthetase (NDP forming)
MQNNSGMLSFPESIALLKRYGVALAPAQLVHTPAQAATAARKIGFPVAVKAVSARFTHKSDAGLLRLNLISEVEVELAAASLAGRIPPDDLEGILVQGMVIGGTEMIVGIHRDPQFGPVVVLGAGGTLVEVLEDVVMRLAPITSREALDMIQELRIYRILQGYRGCGPGDVAALQHMLVQVSHLAVEQQETLLSLDLNPVIVMPDCGGVAAIDFRIYIRGIPYESD